MTSFTSDHDTARVLQVIWAVEKPSGEWEEDVCTDAPGTLSDVCMSAISNPLLRATVITLVLYQLHWVASRVGFTLLRHVADFTTTEADNHLVKVLEQETRPTLSTLYKYFVVYLVIWAEDLAISASVDQVLRGLFLSLLTWRIVAVLHRICKVALGEGVAGRDGWNEVAMEQITYGVLVSLGVLFVTDNLGIEMSTVLTGLGLGGLSIP